MSIWGSIKNGIKKAGKVIGGVVGGPVGTVEDGAENKGKGQIRRRGQRQETRCMTATGYHRGHAMRYVGDAWRYADDWAGRWCQITRIQSAGTAGRRLRPEGHDGCLGTLPRSRECLLRTRH